LPETRYFVHDAETPIPIKSRTAYIDRLKDKYKKNAARYMSHQYYVSRSDVLNVLIKIGEELQSEYHSHQRVHSDIKPSNILLAEKGKVLLIDGLGVLAGRKTRVASPSWGAPEQMLNENVYCSTDVYPLALMLAKTVDAILYGEQKVFVVPFGKEHGGSKQLFILANVGVSFKDVKIFISEKQREAKKAWSKFLMDCLAFEAKKRIPTGSEFASRLKELMKKYPIKGPDFVISGSPGSYRETNDGPVWVVSENNYL